MKKRGRFRLDHQKAAIFISLVLFLIHIIAISISSDWSIRNVYNVFYFFLVSLSILLANALIFSRDRRFFPHKLRKTLRISIIVIYVMIFVSAISTYVSTGQRTRLQTLLFLLNMQPIMSVLFTLGLLLIGIFILVAIIYRKSTLKDYTKKESKSLKRLIVINKILFVLVILINLFFLQIENPIIKDQERLITYRIENPILGQNISKLNRTTQEYNVVFIMLESITAERLGTYGYERNVSPNIDKFAEKSIIFDNAYTTASHSEYAQPGALSSRYVYTNDLRNLFDQDSPRKFIWDIFKENGYITGYFSSQDDRWQQMDRYLDISNLDNYSYSMTDGKFDYGSGYAQKDLDHKTANLALEWLNHTKDQEEPFFLYLNFQSTHNPLTYTKEYEIYEPNTKGQDLRLRGEKANNRYDNSMTYVDAQVGKIIDFIDENNLTNNTIIAITSDHGHDLYNRHDVWGHGNSIYNEELIVPAIFFMPNTKPTRVKERVSNIDFVPTLIDLLGYEIPKEFQGEIMKKNRPLFFVAQSHKYLIGMIKDDIKVIINMHTESIEVYNITEDPQELNNLDSRDYEEYVLQLLFWQYCQKKYYANEAWNNLKEDRCSINNNFKI